MLHPFAASPWRQLVLRYINILLEVNTSSLWRPCMLYSHESARILMEGGGATQAVQSKRQYILEKRGLLSLRTWCFCFGSESQYFVFSCTPFCFRGQFLNSVILKLKVLFALCTPWNNILNCRFLLIRNRIEKFNDFIVKVKFFCKWESCPASCLMRMHGDSGVTGTQLITPSHWVPGWCI